MQPKVSVIIPIYNVEKYLAECIDSVINQTLNEIEIICINDGSTDNSLKIIKEYAKKDNRIKYFTQKNKGAGAARNLGLKHATGEYLGFIDGDDFANPDYLEKLYNKASTTNSDIVVCSANRYDIRTKKIEKMPWALKVNYLPDINIFSYRDMPKYIFNFGQNWNWNKLYRHEFIKRNKIKFQELHRTNDLYFTCCALVLAERITTVKEELINYRVGMNTNSQQTNHLYPLDFYKAFKKLRQFLIKKRIYGEVKQSFVNWAIEGVLYNINSQKDETSKEKLKKHIIQNADKNLDFKDLTEDYVYETWWYRDYKRLKNEEEVRKQKLKETQMNTIFSVKNKDIRKIITILGIKIKFKSQKLVQRKKFEQLEQNINK